MGLPIKRTSQLGQQQLKTLVVGPPGSGKTLFGSTWPDTLYLSAEGGLLVLQELDLPYLEIEASEDLNKARLALEQDRGVREKLLGFDVKTVVLDTIDEIQRMLAKERLVEEHKEALAQADWGWLLEQMRSITRGFRNLDLNVVFTCHTKEEVDQDTGRRSVHPQLQGAYANEITAAFDEVVLLRSNPKTEVEDGKAKRTIERFLQTYPDANHDWVKDRSGKLPPEFRLNFVDDYGRMSKLIFGKGSAEGPRNLRAAVATSSADLRAAQAQKTPEKAPEAPQETKEATPQVGVDEPGESAAEPKKGPDAGAMQAQAMDEAHAASQKAKAAREAEEETRAAAKDETEPEETAPEPEAAAESEAAPPKPARSPAKQTKPKASAKPKEAEPTPEKETGSEAETADGLVCAECKKPYEQTKQLANLQKLFKKPLCPECVATCEICNEKVDDLQKVEFSGIRYRRRLCTPHLQEAGGKKKAS